jgi:hypothetical protein
VAATVPEELDDLDDVTTSSPTSGEALVWDGSKWTNGAPSLDLDDLNDVTITSPSDDEILVYDNGVWVNKANPASTDNFGAPYDENTTYNVPSIVIYNNLLYKLNEGEVDVTGPWDATKWTQTSLAELSGADIPIGTSSDPSTIAGAVGAKADKITLGTYNFSGVWSPSFYSSRSMFIPFANANDYTITLIRARYASDNTTMNDITSTAQIPTGGISEVGIQVTTTTNCDLKYGDIQLKFE